MRAKVSGLPWQAMVVAAVVAHGDSATAQTPSREARRAVQPNLFNDCHFHLTNYVQQGLTMRELMALMGNRVQRVAVFGIPLQQLWSHRNSGDFAPTYYLHTDAPLYYYSFTDAYIATQYLSLPPAQRARLDPMITGFNPSDMYAVEHIRRVLETFPGVFTGIGEFSIHKEFVSAKIAGPVASLQDPALDRILDFAADVGLLVLIHNDIDIPFSKDKAHPVYLDQMRALLARHPRTTIIWAHIGLGRVIQPIEKQAAVIETMLRDPAYSHVYFDISWDEVAKYVVSSPEATRITADLINRHPDRFLFGSDEVGPEDQKTHTQVFFRYGPLWNLLDETASEKVRKANYLRLFDKARRQVRAWERANLTPGRKAMPAAR